MRRLPVLLATLALAASVRAEGDGGEKIHDKKSGLVIEMPDKWSRETARETGNVKFAGLYDITKAKYVLFSVETGPSTGFDELTWLSTEKATATKGLKSMETPWTTEPILIDGARTTRFTVGGKATGEKDYDLRIRGCGLVKNDVFFKITEYSFNRAHDDAADALKAMWEAVKFEEANPFAEEEKEEGSGDEEAAPAGEGGEAPKGEPTVVEDKAGNLKISAPPGWEVVRPPVEDGESDLRLILAKPGRGGNLAFLEVFRFRANNADTFVTAEPGSFLIDVLAGQEKLFEQYYDAGSAKQVKPEIDARARLGGADKSIGYEIRSLKLSEEKQIEDAKTLINRGDTSVKVPEFLPIVVRGRMAMISPYIYLIRTEFARSFSDNEELVAEYNAIADSLEFASMEGKPPPLAAGMKEGEGVKIDALGNTLADPANKAERKGSKNHEFKLGSKAAATLKIDYVLPPGFQIVDGAVDPDDKATYGGENMALQVVAQDENNGWVWIRIAALSSKGLGRGKKFEDKKETFGTWVSNFESLARGAGKMPKEASDVRVGNLTDDGCKLEGKIDNFSATFLGMVTIESGWWIKVEMKTRGTGSKTFAEGIKTFLMKFKATKK